MMKLAIFASLFAGAAAFAPVAQKASSSALKMAFEDELGAQPPLGFFDRTLLPLLPEFGVLRLYPI